ncbi:MAG: CHAT domain-containing protein, partial [Planctomycetes bacterium]|nr:CHAT domain-containing protein [Planctomycetota bacterium]
MRGDSEAALRPRRDLSLETAFLICAGSLLVVSAAIGSLPEQSARGAAESTPPAAAPAPAQGGGRSCADELRALRDDLRRLHRGEAVDRSALRALAGELSEACGREDAPRVTRHLTSLNNLQAMLAGAGIDQLEEALDAYSEDPSFDRADLMRALEALTEELDELQDPLPAAYARRIRAELLLRSEGPNDATLAATLAGSAALTYGRVGFFEQEIEALEVSARALLESSELGEARAHAWRGLQLSRQIGDSLYESLFLRCLVRAADRAGLGLERERLLREWGALARDPERTELEEWWAWAQETVTWLVDEDHPERALSFYKEALHDRRSSAGADPFSSQRLRDQARDLEATVLIRAGELERARALLESGITYTDRSRLLRAYLGLQTLEVVEGRERERTLQELSTLLNPAWISSLPPELLGIAEIYSGEHHHRAGRHERARADLERAVRRALALDRGLAPRSTAGETASLGGEALGLHAVQLLARTYLQLERPLLAARAIEELQSRSLRGGSRGLQETDILHWAEDTQLGLLTWALGPDEGVAVWVGPAGQTDSLLIPHGRRTIQRAVSQLTQALRDESAATSESIGLELTVSLFPSALLERLKSSTGGSLSLFTHGPLASLPAGALRIPRADSSSPLFLSQAATLRTLPGIPDLRPGSSSLHDARWILAGAPEGLDGGPRLTEAVDELNKIHERRPSELIIGEGMTRAAMVTALEGDACLHVATHVMWVETETGPGPAWELARGEALGVVDLPAELGARELVVLMGCESAGGQVLDGEGVLGFSSAFLASGTRNVIATHWPVPDGAARDFGIALHEALLAKSDPSSAVR